MVPLSSALPLASFCRRPALLCTNLLPVLCLRQARAHLATWHSGTCPVSYVLPSNPRTASLHTVLSPFSLSPKTTHIPMSTNTQEAVLSLTARIHVGGQAESVLVSAGPGLSQHDLDLVLSAGPLRQWLDQVEAPAGFLPKPPLSSSSSSSSPAPPKLLLKSILVQGVDYFGKRPGFVKFKAEVVDSTSGTCLPGIVFARGGAVGVLMLLKARDEGDTWQTYAVLTEQVRVPVGRSLLELPAGMLDDDGTDFVGTAAREVEEETGIHIKVSDLVDLTALLEPHTGKKMLPSPGGCDEGITLFLYRAVVDIGLIQTVQGRETGLREHGELISVHVVPYASLWRSSADSKVMSAIALYENGLKEKLIEDTFLPHPS